MNRLADLQVELIELHDDGKIPNHPEYPALLYKQGLDANDDAEEILSKNQWLGQWKGGVHDFHHYHSNTHEVLAVNGGSARLKLGGEKGVEVDVQQGDVLLLPAGFGHKYIRGTADFEVVGAYPEGKEYDMNTGEQDERPENLKTITDVPFPEFDPIFGYEGPMFIHWTD